MSKCFLKFRWIMFGIAVCGCIGIWLLCFVRVNSNRFDSGTQKSITDLHFDVETTGSDIANVSPISGGLRRFRSRSVDLWGYLGPNDVVAIQPIYVLADDFQNGFAIVSRARLVFLLNSKGVEIRQVSPEVMIKRMPGFLAQLTYPSGNVEVIDADGKPVKQDNPTTEPYELKEIKLEGK